MCEGVYGRGVSPTTSFLARFCRRRNAFGWAPPHPSHRFRFYPSSTLRHALPAGARLSYAGDPDWGRDQAMLQDPQIVAAIAFRKIWGVGASTAAKLVFWGLGSIEELRADKEVLGCLNYQQRIGVKRCVRRERAN